MYYNINRFSGNKIHMAFQFSCSTLCNQSKTEYDICRLNWNTYPHDCSIHNLNEHLLTFYWFHEAQQSH